MSSHPTLETLLPFNSKLARLSVDKFPPLALVRSQKFSSICPSYVEYKFHSHSGEGRLVMAMSLTNKRIEEVSDAARDAIFQCFLCGGCDVSVKLPGARAASSDPHGQLLVRRQAQAEA